MKLKQITYKRRKIKVLWQECKDCLAVYEPSESTLTINPNLKGLMLARIIYHELWHIICDLNKIDINKKNYFEYNTQNTFRSVGTRLSHYIYKKFI